MITENRQRSMASASENRDPVFWFQDSNTVREEEDESERNQPMDEDPDPDVS